MAEKSKAVIVNGPVEVGWSDLIDAVWRYAESGPIGHIAAYDADRLEWAAQAIRIRLQEVHGQ